jgi:hemerythrin-like domain-containing protein
MECDRTVLRISERNGAPSRESHLFMKITEALLAEHLVFHNLFDHVETTAPSTQTIGELKTMAALLDAVLRAHTRTEDELFMGPLEQCFEQIGHRETFHQEHEEIDEILGKLQKTLDADQARELLLGVIVLCRQHFDKEERIVFPMAEALLKGETLTQLGQTWMDQRVRSAK